jgi:cytochrome P450
MKDKTKGHPFNEFVDATFKDGKKEVPPIVGFALGSTVALMINSPELAEDVFLTKNKYFDKYPKAARLFSRLLGNSIIFAKSDLKWQQKRKSLSAALYKDKLRAMIDMMKLSTLEIIRNKWMKAHDGKIDIVKESANLFINITQCCLFGSD